jgi:hypothetical protein
MYEYQSALGHDVRQEIVSPPSAPEGIYSHLLLPSKLWGLTARKNPSVMF